MENKILVPNIILNPPPPYIVSIRDKSGNTYTDCKYTFESLDTVNALKRL